MLFWVITLIDYLKEFSQYITRGDINMVVYEFPIDGNDYLKLINVLLSFGNQFYFRVAFNKKHPKIQLFLEKKSLIWKQENG